MAEDDQALKLLGEWRRPPTDTLPLERALTGESVNVFELGPVGP